MHIYKIIVAASLAILSATATSAVTVNGSLSSTDPTRADRLIRNGITSTCASPKTYPGSFGNGPHTVKSQTFSNSGPAQCIIITATVGAGCISRILFVAYNGAFDGGSLSTNYAGDFGNSFATQIFSFEAPADGRVDIVAYSTNALPAGNTCNYTTDSPQLSLAPGPIATQAIPTLNDRALAILSLAMAGFAAWRIRVRHRS